jgi:LmbE family N-acetylglucosaminyl deacetylase
MDGNSRPVLLAILAHPDDESFGMGGTLALYAGRGVQVHLICATRGEVGVMDDEYMEGFTTPEERREHELRCAAAKLGLAGVHFLDYRDSGMPGSEDNHHPQALAAAPVEEVAARLVGFIRRLKPQVVVTFDPIGGYRHPDHIAIHQATVLAFDQAGDPAFDPGGPPPHRPQKLYFHVIPRGFLRFVVRVMPLIGRDPHRWGRNADIDLADLANVEFPTHAVVDFSPVRAQKEAATACHESQGGSAMIHGLMGWALRLNGSRDSYMRAYPAPRPGKVERDLFAGIDI